MATTPARRLAALFAGNPNAYGTHGEPTHNAARNKWEIKSTARTLKEPVTAELWEQHITGAQPLGIIAILPDSTAQWGCIDIDEYQDDLLSLINKIIRAEHPLVPCRSKSGGLHLFLFLTSPVPAISIITLLRDIAARIGHATAEIFPKQASVSTDRGDVGNWIVMPYFRSTYGGKIREQVGLKPTGAEQTLAEFLDAAEGARITPDQLRAHIMSAAPQQINGAAHHPPRAGPRPATPFTDGPPCLEIMTAAGGWETNGNVTLMHAARYAKLAEPDRWREEVERYGRDYCIPPHAPERVVSIIKSHEKKDYEYLCQKEPMRSHCNAKLCRTRRYGIGIAGDYPRITTLTMRTSDPPQWIMDVDDLHLILTTEQMQDYRLFHRAAMEKGRCYRQMRQDDWYQILHTAMENLETQEASTDVSVRGIFHEYLENFLTNGARGQKMEDILSGRPFEDEEKYRHYFTLAGLMTSLKRQGDKNPRREVVTQYIKDLGGGHEQKKVGPPGKKKNINVWWIPSAAVQATPTPDPPPMPTTPL